MRILLSNDDGYGAPGLEALVNYLGSEHEVWVIAPDSERSSTGHSLTLQEVLRIDQIKENHFTCNGFPADCINLGLQTVMKDCLPDLVISGVNRGSNLAQDIYYSGTCAAAREANFFGIPSLSLSLDVRRGQQAHYKNLFPIVDKIISEGIHKEIPKYCSLNINAPNTEKQPSEWKFCEFGFARYDGNIHQSTDPKGRDYFWIGSGSRVLDEDQTQKKIDVYWVKQGIVSVTPCRWIPSMENDFSKVEELLG